ncbi:helix-turn-helix transcriptional regulator [Bradyrhizobium sp. INPA01-394B]|uniref:Helix-turn-helix transcriptional regulator n=1 Tax=Bradyrhizobium campsiandrae TaxID=1729892 RepID=A0ABR7U3Z1_9BRAD|nr:helix-turn-helix transcriptional regulator [Bradyrhizobium campsiandrae]MBC9877658.1 helix-turn-helix transcriptional regulator [Bradyrhizobium campsiandrae]MBC9978102.1 helix-turn-helix transcriptional regulator [Bradyrhizobium campsiandrae]
MGEKQCRRKAAHAAEGSTLRRAFQAGLEELRVGSGLSRREFAERLGIPRSSYFHLMTSAANPSLDYIELIAERAGIDPLKLLHQQGSPTAGRRADIRDARAAR